MTYFFSLQNPSHYRCSQNWVLEDVPPLIDLVDKAKAMERLRVCHPVIGPERDREEHISQSVIVALVIKS